MTIEAHRKSRTPAPGRVIRNVSHGGEVVAPTADELTVIPTTAFNYLFEDLAADFPNHHLPTTDAPAVVAALKQLGAAMVEDPAAAADPFQSTENSAIPPVYTYWGQFIDHDLTANTDREGVLGDVTNPDLVAIPPAQVAHDLGNLRDPALNLDSVYGDGPTLDPAHPTSAADQYDGVKLKLGTVALANNDPTIPMDGAHIGPDDDNARDLPRVNKEAVIGDGRNDENLIIAQLHTAFLRFHNVAVDWVRAHEPERNTDVKVFRRARQLTRWHHQWLVVNDYLKTVTFPGSTDKVLLGGNKFFKPWESEEIFMPLEFSVAAFRFGHSMVRGEYDFSRNFGRPGLAGSSASFFLLFAFTGKGFPAPFVGRTDTLPFNWVIEWDRFVHRGSAFPDHFARRIDTQLTPPLRNLSKEGNAPGLNPTMKSILKSLATRNLLRGYMLSIPTGQAVAQAMGITPLTTAELTQGNNAVVNDALVGGGFITRTPLWYYILKEAEVQAAGESLGEVGSRIVNETILGQLRADSSSYLAASPDWDPSHGITLPNGDPVVSIGDFLTVAGVM